MGEPVFILGKSASGKTFSLKNFPEELYTLIEVYKTRLPFKSSKKFNKTDDIYKIKDIIYRTPKKAIVIDDTQYLMSNIFMNRIAEKGWEKFNDIGFSFWDLLNFVSYEIPEDKIVYLMHHTEYDIQGGIKAKTIGKLLDDKITLEGMFNIVIMALIVENKHFFATQSDGTNPVKTPFEMFPNVLIDNNLFYVDTMIRNYFNMEALQ